MKIVGGSFGLEGGAYMADDGSLVINGTRSGAYRPVEIRSVAARADSQRKFSLVSFFLGALLLGGAGAYFAGFIGLALGVILSGAGSFHTARANIVDLHFADNESVSLKCSSGEVKKLVALRANIA